MVYMTQKQYLSELSRHLRFRFSDTEIDDIVSDMNEFFEAGAADGKSEDDICLSLGKPKEAAASLLGEQKKDPAGFAARLLDHWVPVFISAFVICIFFYLGLKHEVVYIRTNEIALYAIPLLIWFLLERTSFFKSILKYKADLFTFAGSVLIFVIGIIFNIFIKSLIISGLNNMVSPLAAAISPLAVSISVLIFASMVMLMISIWKYAPRPLFYAAVIVSAVSVYKLIQTCCYFVIHFSSEMHIYGLYLSYYCDLMFLWGGLLMAWSLFRRSSLTLPSAYFSMVTIAEIFYIEQCLSRLDPNDERSLPFLLDDILNYKSYLIGGILSVSILVMVIIVKKTGSRRKDDK